MAAPIRSFQNPLIKTAMRLRQSRQRQKQGQFLVDGSREISRALDAGWPLAILFYCPESLPSEGAHIIDSVARSGTRLVEVTLAIMKKISFGNRLDGLLAVAERRPLPSLSDWTLPSSCLLAVLECIEKPGNLGAILRSADAAGVDAVILAEQQSDPFSPNAIRASSGVVFSMPIYQATSLAARDWLIEQGCQVLASRVDAQAVYHEVSWSSRTAVVLGEESAGLSECWEGEGVEGIRIPMAGQADSLNVSNTAAILFFEARR